MALHRNCERSGSLVVWSSVVVVSLVRKGQIPRQSTRPRPLSNRGIGSPNCGMTEINTDVSVTSTPTGGNRVRPLLPSPPPYSKGLKELSLQCTVKVTVKDRSYWVDRVWIDNPFELYFLSSCTLYTTRVETGVTGGREWKVRRRKLDLRLGQE